MTEGSCRGISAFGSYIDDIVIYSDIREEHLRTMIELFGRLRRARAKVQPTTCFLGADRMEFLGHQIGGDVITPRRDNLWKVRKTLCLTTKKQLRSFLGLVGYYRDHIPAVAEILSPLESQNNGMRHRSLLNQYLHQELAIKLPDLMKPFVPITDASGGGVGCTVAGDQSKVVPSRLHKQEDETSRI